MKNSKRLKVLCIAVLMPLFSCQKNEPVLEVRKITPAMIGEIHNRVMTNFKNNYVPNKGMTEDQIIDDIISYNLNLIDEELKGFRKIELDYMGNFYMREIFNTEQLIHNSFIERSSANSLSQKKLKASDMNVFEMINTLAVKGIVSSYEEKILNKLMEIHKQNYDLEITDSELYNEISSIRDKYYDLNIDNNSIGYYLTASCLEISLSSNVWWQENLSSAMKKEYVKGKVQIAPWILVDFIGAFGGAVWSIIEQGSNDHTSPLDPEELLYAMLKSGVISSVSPWSRIAKFFKL